MRVKVPASVTEPEAWHVIEYGDHEFRIPPNPNTVALEAMEEERVMGFVRAIIEDDSPEQWATFQKVFNTADLDAFADALVELYGATPGELEASGATSTITTQR